MVDTIELGSWEEFESAIAASREERKHQMSGGGYRSEFLFRGQADYKWDLKTTLERYTKRELLLSDYHLIIDRCKPEIETFTGLKWDILPYDEFFRWEQEEQASVDPFTLPGYDYMIYLRHYRFPSPLLDWTRSPYIAAFFAFNAFPPIAEKVSIFVYQEFVGHPKKSESEKPSITQLRSYVPSTHKRHFFQKSEYTICTIQKEHKMYYTCHENVFGAESKQQDRLIKYTLPASEGEKVLKQFDKYNLSEFTLYGTEESLMSSMALREFYLKY